jgi:predicted ATP-binding protein involved in virulence
MNIKTLRVQNFKNFEDKTFEFSQGFNLIIGDNGTGKTALLDALAIGLGGYLNPIDQNPTRTIQSHEVHQKSHLSGESYTFESQYPTQIEISATFSEQVLIWRRNAALNSIGLKKTTTRNITNFAKEIQKSVSQGKEINLPIVVHYSTGRLWVEKIVTQSKASQLLIRVDPLAYENFVSKNSRLNGYHDALNNTIDRKKLFVWFLRMELIWLQEGKPMKIYETVKQAVKACLIGCDKIYFDVKRGELMARIDGKPMPFNLLSDGQRSMLAMVADIAYRMAQLNPHLLENVTLETPGVVLIDELDLHLHPKWQRKVIENLQKAFPKVQFIATTHSPFIIQSVRIGELIDLNENPGAAEYQDKSIEDIAEQVQGVYMPQRSQRELEMLAAAKEYYQVLERTKDAKDSELKILKERLDTLSEPYADDIAYIAFLEAKRLSALKERV